MAKSKCPSCESNHFEMVDNNNVKGTSYKVMFIQCSKCGTVVGITDFYHTASLLEKIAKNMGFKLFN